VKAFKKKEGRKGGGGSGPGFSVGARNWAQRPTALTLIFSEMASFFCCSARISSSRSFSCLCMGEIQRQREKDTVWHMEEKVGRVSFCKYFRSLVHAKKDKIYKNASVCTKLIRDIKAYSKGH
jgi:hypothetical protein